MIEGDNRIKGLDKLKNEEEYTEAKRNFDYYLTIEHTINKDYIRIGVTEMMKLQYALHEAYKFFTDSKYSNLYAKKDDDLILYMKKKYIRKIIMTF